MANRIPTETLLQSPKICVLLLNWRGWSDTIECLETLFRQHYPRFHVVICDNDSQDGSLDRIAAWARGEVGAEVAADHPLGACSLPGVPKPVRYRQLSRDDAESGVECSDVPLVLIQTGENLGFAGGNNVGIRWALAQGDVDYIWLLNNDTVVDPDALSALVDVAEQDALVGMVGSRVLYYDEPTQVQALAGGRVNCWTGFTRHLDEGDEHGSTPVRLDYVTGSSLLVRGSLVKQLGALDERYFLYSEEVDWCLRARRKGWKLAYAAGSRIWHKGGRSVGYGSALHDYHTVRGMLLLVGRFYPARLPVAIAYSALRCLAPKLVRLQYTRMKAVLRAYRDLIRGNDSRIGSEVTAKPGIR